MWYLLIALLFGSTEPSEPNRDETSVIVQSDDGGEEGEEGPIRPPKPPWPKK